MPGLKNTSDLEAEGDLARDAESADGDLATAGSPELWRMIEQRRRGGSSMSLAEAKARLEARARPAGD